MDLQIYTFFPEKSRMLKKVDNYFAPNVTTTRFQNTEEAPTVLIPTLHEVLRTGSRPPKKNFSKRVGVFEKSVFLPRLFETPKWRL